MCGRKRIVRAVDRARQRQWRQALAIAKRAKSRLVAHSEVDAEVNVSGFNAVDLEPVVDAGRAPVHDLARERRARSVSLVDVDAG